MTGRESHHDLEGEEHDHDDFVSFVVPSPTFPSLDDLRASIVAALALPGVLRIKGRARVDGKPAAAIVQAVGPRVETWFAPALGMDGLVVIGLKGIDRAAIEARLVG